MNKQKIFKAITLTAEDVVKFLDIEEIRASNLNEATKLVSDIQVAEYKQASKPYTKELESYSVLFAQKIGFVQGEQNFVTLIIGQDNEWFQYIHNNRDWNSIIEFEWEDYVKEVFSNLN